MILSPRHLRFLGFILAATVSIPACSRQSGPEKPAVDSTVQHPESPERGSQGRYSPDQEPSAAEAEREPSPMFQTFLARSNPRQRVLEAPALVLAKLHTDPVGCRQVVTQVLKHDLWEGEETEIDGVTEVHISPESFQSAREVFRIFAASYPASAAEILNDVPGEIREPAIRDWAKSAPGLPLEQLRAFLAPLAPDQLKTAGWLLVEETYYTDPSRGPALAGLARLLPENPMHMMSKISQYRPTRDHR